MTPVPVEVGESLKIVVWCMIKTFDGRDYDCAVPDRKSLMEKFKKSILNL